MMEMSTPYLSSGAPWMDAPPNPLPDPLSVDRSSSYHLTEEQIAFVKQYWLYWQPDLPNYRILANRPRYEADNRYGLPTIAFFVSTVLVFAFAAFLSRYAPKSVRDSNLYRRKAALYRYLSYKGWKISALRWYSPSAGVWLLGGVGAIFFFSMMLGPRPYYWPNTHTLSFGNSPPIATRSGWMSIACLPFLLMLSAKENPISLLTRVPYERLMVFHKWVAWAMYVLALVHTFPFIIFHVWKGDMYAKWKTDVFYWTGVVAIAAQTWLQFMSIGPVRNRFYEFFKAMHFAMGALFFAFLFIHCGYTLTSWSYLIAAAVIYTACLLTSQLRTWFEHGINSHATIEMAESGTIKVSIPTTSPWYPGQHVFVRFILPSLHGLTAHPFTICSLPISESGVTLPDVDGSKADMIFYIQPFQGITGRLSAIAKSQPNRKIQVLLDGPYGGMKDRNLETFDHALVIAGGSGAGFTLPVIEDYLRTNFPAGKMVSSQVRPIHVIAAFKTDEYCAWYQDVLQATVKSCGFLPDTDALKVDIYVTCCHPEPKDKEALLEIGKQDSSSSNAESYIRIHHGPRPNLPQLIDKKIQSKQKSESLGMAVCGPASMLFDVRNTAASAQLDVMKSGSGEIWLYHEHFGW